jgi:transposase
VVDSQAVPDAATVAKGSLGYDAGKRVNGRKRHLEVGAGGLLLVVLVTAASVQDHDGGIRVLDRARMAMPSLALVQADAAYGRRCIEFAARALRLAAQAVAKVAGQRGFAPLPRQWGVERTHAWITGNRRLSRDYERLPAHAEG